MIDLNTVPTWVVSIVMLYTAYMWVITIKHKVRMDSKIIAYTLLLWGIMYGLASLTPDSGRDITVTRVFMSRIVIIMICLSQALPLTVSYFRSKSRGE